MTLEEIIFSDKVLFDEKNKLREGGKRFLEHISKYAKKVVILGFKSIYAPELSFYITNHQKNTNLVLNMDSELTYHLLSEDEVNLERSIYIASNEIEIDEAIDCKIRFITFCYPNLEKKYLNFNGLKEITGYLSRSH